MWILQIVLKGEKEKIEGDNVLHTTLLKKCNQYRIWLTITIEDTCASWFPKSKTFGKISLCSWRAFHIKKNLLKKIEKGKVVILRNKM